MCHCYRLNGYNIVIDGNSGGIHACDELTYDIIALRDGNDAERALALVCEAHPNVAEDELLQALTEIDELVNDGLLFAPPVDETPFTTDPDEPQTVKALCLNVAHACNLRCEYCFASKSTTDGELMSFETGKTALDFLIANSRNRSNLEVDFFGGEPLLNWDVVKRLVAYARSLEAAHGKNFRFTLTTNGVLLDDEVLDFCNREFENVVLSLDGRKEVHDRFRKTPGGGGSFDTVVPKFQRFVERRQGGYYIRGTYTAANSDFVNDILQMSELGFKHLSMEPVVSNASEPYALTEAHLPALFEQYELLASEMAARQGSDREFTFYHYMLDLENGPCLYKRVTGCGCGSEYLAVTPDGTLYPCHQFVGEPEYAVGTVFNGISRPDIIKKFAAVNIFTRPECPDCWAKLWCAGGCAANSFRATGDVAGIYKLGCELFKKRLECAIMLQFATADAVEL